MFRFTITELTYKTLSVRKVWRSFPSLLPQMSRLSRSGKGKLTFWPLDPVWSPCKRVKSNDGTVLPKFDPVWSPQIQPNAEPKLELSRVTKWSTVFPKFDSVWSPKMSEFRSAKLVIIQPNAVPKQKLLRLTKWSPIIILALPLLLRKYSSVPLESKCVLPCNLSAQKNRVFKGMLVAQSREHRCRNACFVHSKQSHRRKRNREPSRIPKTKLVRLYYHRKKRKHLKILLKQKVPMSSELHYFFKKSNVTDILVKVVSVNTFTRQLHEHLIPTKEILEIKVL